MRTGGVGAVAMTKSEENLVAPAAQAAREWSPTERAAERARTAGAPAFSSGWLKGGMAVFDAGGRLLRVNEALARWLRADSSSLEGHSCESLLAARFPDGEAALFGVLRGAVPFARVELNVPDGPARQWFALEVARHGETAFLRLESMLPPVGELAEDGLLHGHREGEADGELFVRLLRAETQLQNLLHRWPGVIFSQRPDFSFAFISPRIEELTGLPPAQWEAQTDCFWRAVHEADVEALQARLRNGGSAAPELTGTFRLRHAHTGRVIYVWEHREAVRSRSGLLLGYEGVWLDTTRQTIAERRLSTLAWKESMGVLTMGLTHDFTNLLAGILSLTESFEAQVAPGHPFQEGLALIRRNTGSASQLVRRIRQLHQGTAGEKAYHDLNEIVTDMAELLGKIVPRRIQFETALASRQLPIYADAFELRQVIVNLTLNAVDAMPNRGRLVLGTAPAESTAGAGRPPGVLLSVRDTGTGIPACYRASIYDPFFTTKPLTKGSGLGLYNARLFVEKHGGAITYDTADGAGTTFYVWLPEADFTEAQRSPAQPPQRRHTLLVAGDEAKGPERMARFLREQGYYVVAAGSRERAVELLHSPDYQFSGVVALAGSGDGGLAELFGVIRRERLPVRTILHVTGCQQDEMDTQFLALADVVVGQDQNAPEFLNRLRTILDPSPSPRL